MKNSANLIQQVISIHVLMCLVVLLPVQLIAQKKNTSKLTATGYGSALYRNINSGQYMKAWSVAGPFFMNKNDTADQAAQEKFFNEDLISQVSVVHGKPLPSIKAHGKEFAWQSHISNGDIIDLDAIFSKVNYAAGYAMAEVEADSSYKALLAIGSDDGVKVWHNGKLIHKNWIARPLTKDDDVVPITLIKGTNQLLLKVQDIGGDWSFTARFLDKAAVSDRLVAASLKGRLDDIDLLLNAGADINKENSLGITALNAAEISGRNEMINFLTQKGANKNPLPAPELLIDRLYSSLNDKASPGVALLVAKDGKILYKKGFSYSEIENKTLVTPDTKFRIGSITKQFTGAAILKLQEDGLLQVTDKLSKYIADFPRGEEITLHHLLTHTSGIHSYTNKNDFISKVTSPVTNEELLNYFKNDPYDFNPGDEWRYNNSGYFLLGYIIEKVSGKSYGQYLKEKFFDPLEMRNTGVHASSLKLEKEAKGYIKPNNAFEKALNWDMSWAGGAGALYSTVEDLYKWNEALFSGKVLNEKSMKAAFTPVVLNNGKLPTGANYGYGWGLGNYRGREVIQHSGGLHGFLSQLSRYPKDNLTVVMLTNVTPAQVDLNPNTIAEFYLWDKMDKQSSYSVNASSNQDLKIYEGRYDFQNGAVMVITSDGKNLFAQLSGQPKFQIFPSSPDEFFWKVVEAKIKFIRNEKGEITHGHFIQGMAGIQAARLKDEVIVSLDPAIYKDYVGKYNYGNDIVISITTENGKIFSTATNQPKFEIFPLSENEFLFKDLNARITFFREPDGKISKLIVNMAGQKKDAPKTE